MLGPAHRKGGNDECAATGDRIVDDSRKRIVDRFDWMATIAVRGLCDQHVGRRIDQPPDTRPRNASDR